MVHRHAVSDFVFFGLFIVLSLQTYLVITSGSVVIRWLPVEKNTLDGIISLNDDDIRVHQRPGEVEMMHTYIHLMLFVKSFHIYSVPVYDDW